MYRAELHSGESVLTASQSQALRNAGMLTANADGTPNLDISNLGVASTMETPSINEETIVNKNSDSKVNNVSNNFSITVNATATDAKPADIGIAVRREIEKLISTTQAAMGTS